MRVGTIMHAYIYTSNFSPNLVLVCLGDVVQYLHISRDLQYLLLMGNTYNYCKPTKVLPVYIAVIAVVSSLACKEKPFGNFAFPPVTCIDLTSTFSTTTLPQSVFGFVGIIV